MRNPRTPLDSVIESYLLHCQDKKPRTREFYAQQLATFTKWLRANEYDVVLGDVEPSVVNQYVMSDRGFLCSRRPPRAAVSRRSPVGSPEWESGMTAAVACSLTSGRRACRRMSGVR